MKTPQKLLFQGVEVTKSLSNLIKFYNFHVTEEDKKLLDSDSKVDSFIPGIISHGEVELRDLEKEEFDAEFPEEMFEDAPEAQGEELLPDELLKDAHEQAELLLENARAQAEEIIEQAKVTGEVEKKKVIEEGRKRGYQEGLVKANDEVAAQKEALEAERIQLESDYQQKITELEPTFVELVMGLLKKLTGVLVENKKDIILYLMEQSLKDLGKVKHLVIRVSPEDVELIQTKEEELRDMIGSSCEMEILSDGNLHKNQCILDLDNQIIDCSLDVQLQGLLEDLKMML